MSRPVRRDEIVDYQTYEETRAEFRAQVLAEKAKRRIHLGEHLTFLFENTLTMRYQVQEMMRTEQIVKEADIVHELETYNGLLGGPGELGCTLLIEIPDESQRPELLSRWIDLPQKLYVRLEDGGQAPASFDAAQVGDTRLSSVQYLKFEIGSGTPVALGVAGVEGLDGEIELSEEQRAALLADLADGSPGR